ncbi:MAG: bifunctional DNA primase/polymerase, partial [Proteobacteria bacterium]|nr:bifunctional DNA primase/polymerase [Pseudomonadota bacterium]
DYCRAILGATRGLTGAAISPHPDDPQAIIILDIDDHTGRSTESIWSDLTEDPMPADTGVSRTANGGAHFWFRLHPDTAHKQLPRNGIDFGGGLKGDLFHSMRKNSLVVLPGSQVNRKNGTVGAYKEESAIVPAELPYIPDSILRRLLARKDVRPTTKPDALPTECLHLLRHYKEFGAAVPVGKVNTFIAEVGLIMGRIAPQPKPSDAIMELIHQSIAPGLAGYDPADMKKAKEFRQAVNGGWKTGRKNREQYDRRDTNPTVTDVLAECRSIFGGEPWLHELRPAGQGKPEFLLGLGGSAKTPNQAFADGRLDKMDELLPTLERISQAEPDSVALSPFQVQRNWLDLLKHHLTATKAIHYVGTPPEEAFIQLLRDAAQEAADAGKIYGRLGEKREGDARASFILWPEGQDDRAALIVPDPADQEAHTQNSGDIAKAQRLVKRSITRKEVQGGVTRRPAWSVPLSFLGDELMASVGAAYEKKLARA